MRSAWQTGGSNRSRNSHHIVESPVGHSRESGFYFHCNGQPFEGFKLIIKNNSGSCVEIMFGVGWQAWMRRTQVKGSMVWTGSENGELHSFMAHSIICSK